jgi:hypothetical protein
MRHSWYLMFLLSSSLLFTACGDNEVCEDATANKLRIGFYIAGQETETIASVNSLTVYALAKPDNLIYDNQNNVSSIELPLNPLDDECAFVLSYNESADTLWFSYHREEHLISVECGFTLFFTIQNVDHTTHFMEALGINNAYVTNNFDEHIKVYFPDPGLIVN